MDFLPTEFVHDRVYTTLKQRAEALTHLRIEGVVMYKTNAVGKWLRQLPQDMKELWTSTTLHATLDELVPQDSAAWKGKRHRLIDAVSAHHQLCLGRGVSLNMVSQTNKRTLKDAQHSSNPSRSKKRRFELASASQQAQP